jgi:hypothetical protein
MTYTYKIVKAEGLTVEHIEKQDDNENIWFIPTDPANSDYQEYLKTLEA